MLKKILPVSAGLLIVACSHEATTDTELAGEAQQAVDKELDAQGTFSLMEAVSSRHIAFGHVTATNVPGGGNVDQDFVYQNSRLIMDDDPDFDSAAIACDSAAGGGNSADANDDTDN